MDGIAIGQGIGGAVVVIGFALIPLGRYQRGNGRRALGGTVGQGAFMALQVSNLTVHLIQPVLHGRRQGVCRKITGITIAQHLGQAVVAGNDDVTSLGTAVIDVKTVVFGCQGKPHGVRSGWSHKPRGVLREEVVGHLTCICLTDLFSLHAADRHHREA